MTTIRILHAVLGLMVILSIAICSSQAGNLTVTQKVYFDIAIDDFVVGRIVIGLFGQTCPKTVANFAAFAAGAPQGGYRGSMFHRIIKNFVVQGGDFLNGDGTGFTSIYGTDVFPDENFILKNLPMFVNMANKGVDTNGSQFSILLVPAPWLDGKHVVFGKVLEGMNIVHRMENLATNVNDHPISSPTIASCGVMNVTVPFDVTTD